MKLQDLIHLLKTSEDVRQIDVIREEIAELIPKVRIMFEYDQKNSAHQYDLWMHSLHTVINLPRNLDDDMLYLGAFLHDIGKPDSRCVGKRADDTDMHYYGHPVISKNIVENEIIIELDNKGYALSDHDKKRLLYYVEHHDDDVIVDLKHFNSYMKIATFEEFHNLMLLEIADAKAHVQIPIVALRLEKCSALAGEEGEKLYKQYLLEHKM